jgi:hypothetical protein
MGRNPRGLACILSRHGLLIARAPEGVTSGIVLAGVLCIPRLRTLGQVPRRAVVPADGLWFVMLPVITVYGFGG